MTLTCQRLLWEASEITAMKPVCVRGGGRGGGLQIKALVSEKRMPSSLFTL